jgi:hypothetical protein
MSESVLRVPFDTPLVEQAQPTRLIDEVRQWCDESGLGEVSVQVGARGDHKEWTLFIDLQLTFASVEDAMLFKIRWM